MKYIFLSIFLSSSICLFSQYNVKAYIVKSGKDTTWGTIAIPVVKDELDQTSLSKSIFFSDGTTKAKKMKPKDIVAFGIIDEGITSDYVAFIGDQGDFFAKQLVDGQVDLFEQKKDTAVYGNLFLNSGRKSLGKFYSDRIHSPSRQVPMSVYYLRTDDNVLMRIDVDPDNSTILARDVKRIQELLPKINISKPNISIGDLADLIRDYNSKVKT